MNIHPSIFPKLIDKYNNGGIFGPRFYYEYLKSFGFSRGEARKIKKIIMNWIVETNYPIKFNNYDWLKHFNRKKG